MADFSFTDRQVTHLLMALRHYQAVLVNDEKDPGPAMMDALVVEDLIKRLQAAKLTKPPS
ncbi:MAG TPA: hypothetical protein PK362_03380 [Elusimicrobiota bacterium]|nr:hypothetical protein [Elusimicrobiota bacterium]HNC73916.1 hypothetical protein [Elusimicrobiota bacterium]HND63539.1 hypothetical protein [Elusimicrobiota bacterium]HNG44293.1 hypothetical protein [Elusimicrobiota bacterium]